MERRRCALLVLVVLLGALGAGPLGAPATADPNGDQDRVNRQLARTQSLYEDASTAVQAAMRAYTRATQALPTARDRLADARGLVAARQADARQAGRDALAARREYRTAIDTYTRATGQMDAACDQVSALTAAAYKGSGLFALASLLESRSPGEWADRLNYLDQIAQVQNRAVTQFTVARTAASVARAAAQAARVRADAADRAARAALSVALTAQGQAERAQTQVTDLIGARAGAVRAANAQRATVLARYRALKRASDRIAAQLRALSGARSNPTGVRPGALFLMPVHGWKSSSYGYRYDPYYHVWQLHTGVDLAAGRGTPIHAAAGGRVVRAGWDDGGYGNYTCLYHGRYHGAGLSSCYAHQSRILVHPGQVVHRGQVIGLVGTTGASTGYHLHFEVRVDGTPVQPLNWLPGCLC